MDPDEVTEKLQSLGLSHVESRIYVTTVKTASNSIDEAARKVGPRLHETERAVEHRVELRL